MQWPVAKKSFGHNWKLNQPQAHGKDALPATSNIRHVEIHAEPLTLASITEEIMSDDQSTVAYSNDGLAKSWLGNFVVISIRINVVQTALWTLGIYNESCERLKEF